MSYRDLRGQITKMGDPVLFFNNSLIILLEYLGLSEEDAPLASLR